MRSPKGEAWWAHKGSNLGPLPCEGNALPLSYAPGRSKRGPIRAAIYEAAGAGVKPGLSPFVVPADAPGHRHNDPSSSAEADDPVFRAISARYLGPRRMGPRVRGDDTRDRPGHAFPIIASQRVARMRVR